MRVKTGADLRRRESCGNQRVSGYQFLKAPLPVPGFHGAALHRFIGSLAFDAFLDQRQQEALGIDQSSGHVQVFAHSFGIHHQPFQEIRQTHEHVVNQNRAVGNNNAFHRGMADVPFMPERDVFHRRQTVGSNDSCKATEVFGPHRISFVRHGRGPFLPWAEMFFGFQDFGSLEVTKFDGYFFNAGGHQGQGAQKCRVAVPLDDLIRNWRGA